MHNSICRRIWMCDNSPQWTRGLNWMSNTRTPFLSNKTKVCLINVATYICLKPSNQRLHKKCTEQMYLKIYISCERRYKNRTPHWFYLQNSLSFAANVCIESKMWPRNMTTINLGKCRIFCENYLTNNGRFFQLMTFRFVVAVRQTTGHHTA